jgi:hypothetical protein
MKAQHAILTLCRHLEVSASGYYDWQRRRTAPGPWLKKECPKDADRKSYLRSHHIPDLSLELSDFGEFFEKRRVLLKGKLAELLNVPMKIHA